nr:hypothetical protein [Tanacetum cinerariifolium]
VVAIVRVVIAIIRVVAVVGGVFIIKLLFVIIGVLCRIVFYYLIHQPLGYIDSFLKNLRVQQKEFKTLRDRHGNNGMSDLIGGLDTKIKYDGFPLSSWILFEKLLMVSSMIISRDKHFNKDSLVVDIVDLVGDEDPTDEDGDTEVSVSLGEISLEGKKSWESNIGDSDNTGDGGKTAGRAIITWGGEIALYACMASIYGSSCKGEKISMSKIYLVKSFEELGELFLGIVGRVVSRYS